MNSIVLPKLSVPLICVRYCCSSVLFKKVLGSVRYHDYFMRLYHGSWRDPGASPAPGLGARAQQKAPDAKVF